MKTNGLTTTLGYDAAYWTNTATLNVSSLNVTSTDAKFTSFLNQPFTQVRAGMKRGTTTNWLQFNYTAASMRTVMNAGFKAVSVPRNSWKALIGADASLQANCNRVGFNNHHTYTRVRLGILGNQENDCNSPDSRIGFGGAGNACGQDNGNSTGNTATCAPDNGDKNIKAYGYILVR